ncbi:hypothetical protein Ddye_004579 [Dipteronia dyeriana]|uniref:Uncharacterized protein n=1 Tax=Dipteronia dyeriana TaxID=168575 RepID=A0AAD9XVB8_9ROSI|nr:hypothetical protein Ddye_004579 [Dipteronia dyeriana]
MVRRLLVMQLKLEMEMLSMLVMVLVYVVVNDAIPKAIPPQQFQKHFSPQHFSPQHINAKLSLCQMAGFNGEDGQNRMGFVADGGGGGWEKNRWFRSASMVVQICVIGDPYRRQLMEKKKASENYLLWKSLFIPILLNSDLYSLLDGSDPCLPKTLSTDFVLPYTVGCVTVKTLWDTLDKLFVAITRSHILQLKGQLQTLKKGSNSMMQYFEKIKSLVDGLIAVGAPLDDIDVIAHTLHGLPSEYDSFGTSIPLEPRFEFA